jgi:hypothetical protein
MPAYLKIVFAVSFKQRLPSLHPAWSGRRVGEDSEALMS